MSASPNPYQLAARLKKAEALADVLFRWHITAAQVADFDADNWHAIARAADVNPPSDETRQIVVDNLRRLEVTANGSRIHVVA